MVVGGGITGLAAAHEARRQGLDAVVLEAATRAGGKIDSGFVDGAELRSPSTWPPTAFSPASRKSSSSVTNSAWAMTSSPPPAPGVHLGRWCAPFDPHAFRPRGAVRARHRRGDRSDQRSGRGRPGRPSRYRTRTLAHDASVGEVMRPRVGDEVFERLVDPLLGGINAGNADGLSIEAAPPTLCGRLRRRLAGDGLRAQVTAGQAAAGGPVFNGSGGNRRIIDTLVEQLGSRVRLGQTVVAIERDGAGWVVVTATPGSRRSSRARHRHGSPLAGRPFAPTAATPSPTSSTATPCSSPMSSTRQGSSTISPARLPRPPLRGVVDDGVLVGVVEMGTLRRRTPCDPAGLRRSHRRSRWLDLDPAQLLDHLGASCHRGPARRPVTESRRGVSRPSIGPATWPGATRSTPNSPSSRGLVVAGAQMRGLGLPACVRQGVPPSRNSAVCPAQQFRRERKAPRRDHRSVDQGPAASAFLRARRRSPRCADRRNAVSVDVPQSDSSDDLVVTGTHQGIEAACRKLQSSSEPLGRSSTTLSGCVTEWSAHALGVLPWVPWAKVRNACLAARSGVFRVRELETDASRLRSAQRRCEIGHNVAVV